MVAWDARQNVPVPTIGASERGTERPDSVVSCSREEAQVEFHLFRSSVCFALHRRGTAIGVEATLPKILLVNTYLASELRQSGLESERH